MEWKKQQHFITHASRSLLWIQFIAVAFRSEEEDFWRRGPPWPILPRPGSARRQIWPKHHVLGHEHFIPTKFPKHPFRGSVVKTDYVFPYIYSVRETLWNFIGHSVLLGESFHRTKLLSVWLWVYIIYIVFENNIGQFCPTGNEANRTDHIFVLPVRRSDEFGGHCIYMH